MKVDSKGNIYVAQWFGGKGKHRKDRKCEVTDF